jgi:hypothetical protein
LEITENNKSRKIKEFKSKAETALWFVESYGYLPGIDETRYVRGSPSQNTVSSL